MSVSAPVYDKSDPRSEKLFPFHVPMTPEWATVKDTFGSGAMMGAGAGMFIRNPLFVWGALVMAVLGFVGQKPMRREKDAASPLMGLGMGFMGVFSLLMPKLLAAPAVAPAST
ncbi:uncharacterized protein MKK02DRAFT_40021 [Dioszegia hungarica]|uniref:Uncharacterized protein n=1 Tax=Dioszegia hungarica TaxID=4972 RepID=A0AA38HI15_9TREE|nr:uncharacterized protein MKK02DRAFT_40021 [Dioszegia hungarica]KAI9639699.1 hypothetical protein MKK02DRAFT_40021 [Dioszegia hungarica]